MKGIPLYFFFVAGFLVVFLVVFLVPHPFVPHAISFTSFKLFARPIYPLNFRICQGIFAKSVEATYLIPKAVMTSLNFPVPVKVSSTPVGRSSHESL
jgi:hypothetical protein